MQVSISGDFVDVDDDVFRMLLENSVAGTYRDYERALESGRIAYSNLAFLSHKGEIPLPLFFAPAELVQRQVGLKPQKLLAGVSKTTFSIGSRERVALRDVELIVKDLLRKQEVLKRHDDDLVDNEVVGLLRRSDRSPDEDAQTLATKLGLSHAEIRDSRTGARALELLIERLESRQVLVSRSVQHFMPQRLDHVRFSGLTIRDRKVPYIFLAGGDHQDLEEPVGRTFFTLALLTVLIARRIFAPVTFDASADGASFGREYDIAGALLMPRHEVISLRGASVDEIKAAAQTMKVTPSALTVRAMRLRVLHVSDAEEVLRELRVEFAQRDSGGPRSQPRPETAVRKYNGREFNRRMIAALDRGDISPGEFCRTVCLNHLKPHQIGELRRSLS